MATSTIKKATDFRTFTATDIVDLLGIVPELNIRSEYNYKIEQFAKEIISAGEILEPIRITPREGLASDLESARWVVAGDGHRRILTLRWIAENDPAALSLLAPVPCRLVADMPSQEEVTLLMLRSGSEDGKVPLDALEQARGYQRLIDMGWTKQTVADTNNVTTAHIGQRFDLLIAPQEVRDIIPVVGIHQANAIGFRLKSEGAEFQKFAASLALKAKKEKENGKRELSRLMGDLLSQHGLPAKLAAVKTVKDMMADTQEVTPTKAAAQKELEEVVRATEISSLATHTEPQLVDAVRRFDLPVDLNENPNLNLKQKQKIVTEALKVKKAELQAKDAAKQAKQDAKPAVLPTIPKGLLVSFDGALAAVQSAAVDILSARGGAPKVKNAAKMLEAALSADTPQAEQAQDAIKSLVDASDVNRLIAAWGGLSALRTLVETDESVMALAIRASEKLAKQTE